MADRNLILQLLITAKDQASSVFSKLFSSLNDSTNIVAGKVRDAFTGMFGGGLTAAVDFEAQLDRVAAKGGYTGAEMESLKTKTALLGSQFGVTGTEAAKGMEALAAAGLSASDAVATLPPVLALAASEQISTDAAAQKLIDSLSIMGLGFDQAGRMADVLAKGANITTSSAAQLAEALTQAGGMARAAGMDLETTVAALDLLHKNGIKGSEAGTALKSILTSLLDPASTASVELNKLGISSRDLGSVMAALKDKGGAANAAILAFGTEAGPGLRALLEEGQGALDDMTLQLQNADGAAQDAADQMGGNLKSAMKSLNSAWESLKAALLDPLLEPIAKAANELTAAFQTALSDGSIKGVQELLKEFGTGIAEGIKKAVGGFDFKDATAKINQFAVDAKGSFAMVEGAAKATSGAIQVVFNTATAPIKAVVSSIAQTAGNLFTLLSSIERQAAKVGLGTLQKADELMGKANAAKDTARDLMNAAKQDVDDLTEGANKTATAFDGVTGALQKAREEAEKAKPPDLGKAETLTPIKKSLEDYVGILALTKTEQDKAVTAAIAAQLELQKLREKYDIGALSLEDYNAGLARNEAAQKLVETATFDVIQAERDVFAANKDVISGIGQKTIAVKTVSQVLKEQSDATEKQLTLDQKTAEEITKLTNTLTVNAQAELALAKAKGDGNAIAEAQLKLIQNEMTALQAKRAEQEKELAQIQAKSDRMQDLLSRQTILTKAEQAELELLKQQNPVIAAVIAAKETEVKTTNTLIEAKEREKKQAEIMAGPVGQLTRLYAEQSKEHQLAAESSARYQSALTDEAEQTLKLTQINGTKAEQDRAQSALDAQKLRDAQAIATSKAIAATDSENELSALTLKLAADGELSKADQEQLANMAAVAESKRSAATDAQREVNQTQEVAAATREAAAAAKQLAEAQKAAAESAAQLKAAGDAVNSNLAAVHQTFVETGGDVEKLTAAFNDMRTSTTNALSADPWIAWAASVAANADKVVEQYHAQKNALDGTAETLQRFAEEGGNVAEVERLITQYGEGTNQELGLLNEQDLSNLRSAMDSANHKLRDMQQEASDAATELARINAEIMADSGDTAGAKRLQLQIDETQQLADATEKLHKAEAEGNTAAAATWQKVIDAIKASYDLKQRNADQEAKSADQDTKNADKAINNVNRLKTAYSDLNGIDLSGLHNQVKSLAESVNNLRSDL